MKSFQIIYNISLFLKECEDEIPLPHSPSMRYSELLQIYTFQLYWFLPENLSSFKFFSVGKWEASVTVYFSLQSFAKKMHSVIHIYGKLWVFIWFSFCFPQWILGGSNVPLFPHSIEVLWNSEYIHCFLLSKEKKPVSSSLIQQKQEKEIDFEIC